MGIKLKTARRTLTLTNRKKVSTRRAEVAHVDGHRFRPADEGEAGHHRNQRKEHGADRIHVHGRVQRQPSQQTSRRIAEAVGGPGVRGLMHRQRDQEHEERDE
ncbi:MAG: hypothetical protein LC791_20815 [Acidobacteria bacterium]|nr:hypothetical protein [Acidobacteriota bacterium]